MPQVRDCLLFGALPPAMQDKQLIFQIMQVRNCSAFLDAFTRASSCCSMNKVQAKHLQVPMLLLLVVQQQQQQHCAGAGPLGLQHRSQKIPLHMQCFSF